MNETLYSQAIKRNNLSRPPVWFMRQAGRYHSHYQNLKKQHSFIELCKVPELACEVTLGPIRDFDYDAAILFSDLLFPLEILGMGLQYAPGPKLDWHLKEVSDLKKLNPKGKSIPELIQEISYQGHALSLIRKSLPKDKSLLGFVGGPLTLFYYAAEGSHQGTLQNAKDGIDDGRFDGFLRLMIPFLIENMCLQAASGADAIAIMDTCAGEISPWLYQNRVIPSLREVMVGFKRRYPHTPIVYYSKGTGPNHWEHLEGLPFECLGVDWHTPMHEVLIHFGKRWAIQGNFDPHKMIIPLDSCKNEIKKFFEPILKLPGDALKSWVCGLGHGVLQWTPEANVREFLRYQKEVFSK